MKELRTAYIANVAKSANPYEGVPIRTLGEVLWILIERGWPGGLTPDHSFEPAQVQWFIQRRRQRGALPDYSIADFRSANFSQANLRDLDISGADMRSTNLTGSCLINANLTGTLMTDATLEETTFLDVGNSDPRLRAILAPNRSGNRPPYAGAEIHTRNEILHIMVTNGWSGNPRDPNPNTPEPPRADLGEANLIHLDLQCVDLIGANLQGALLIEGDNPNGPRVGRADELEQAYWSNRSTGAVDSETPYRGVRIRNANELVWIFRERGWSGAPDAAENQRPQLGEADLSEGYFAGVDLRKADLREAILYKARLFGAQFDGANLDKASCHEANLCHANLVGVSARDGLFTGAKFIQAKVDVASLDHANLNNIVATRSSWLGTSLHEATLDHANMYTATLRTAILTRANLESADLRGADLRKIYLDHTGIAHVSLDDGTWLGGIDWTRHVELFDIDWSHVNQFADENLFNQTFRKALRQALAIEQTKPDSERRTREVVRRELVQTRRSNRLSVARSYQELARALRDYNRMDSAAKYRIREERLIRHVILSDHKWRGPIPVWALSWSFSVLMDILAGYGERPLKILGYYLATVLGFAVLDCGLAHAIGSPLQWWNFLLFSLTAFHGRGFFPNPSLPPGAITLDSPLPALATIDTNSF